jgi:hypothetical protein
MTKVGLYAINKSTTLKSNKSLARYKQTFGGRLRAKRDASQEQEAALACALLNRMRERGRPQSYTVR